MQRNSIKGGVYDLPSASSCLTRIATAPYHFPTSGLSLAQTYWEIAASHTTVSLYFTVSSAVTVSSVSYKNDHVSSCFEHSSVPPRYFGKRHSRPLKIHPLLMLLARKPPLCDPSPRMQQSMSLPGPSAYWHCPPCLSTGCCQCCQAPCISMSHLSIPGAPVHPTCTSTAVSASRKSLALYI